MAQREYEFALKIADVIMYFALLPIVSECRMRQVPAAGTPGHEIRIGCIFAVKGPFGLDLAFLIGSSSGRNPSRGGSNAKTAWRITVSAPTAPLASITESARRVCKRRPVGMLRACTLVKLSPHGALLKDGIGAGTRGECCDGRINQGRANCHQL